MNTGKYVFAQLVEFLPKRIFDGIAKKSGGNKYVKHFTCWNQLLAMMFDQLMRYYNCLEYHSLIKHPLSSFLTMLKITISKNFFITNNCP